MTARRKTVLVIDAHDEARASGSPQTLKRDYRVMRARVRRGRRSR